MKYIDRISVPEFLGTTTCSCSNWQSAKTGGDTLGGSLRTTSYSANGANQYTSITTAGYEDKRLALGIPETFVITISMTRFTIVHGINECDAMFVK